MPERFTIQGAIENGARPTIDVAVRKSNLPEDIRVFYSCGGKLRFKENEAKDNGDFVVISSMPNIDEMLSAFNAGALKCIVMDFNSDELSKRLNIN